MYLRRSFEVLIFLALFSACNEEQDGGGTSCLEDRDCERGSICLDESCSVQSCESIHDCSWGTCLLDLKSCSAKECADIQDGVELFCPAERSFCLETGPNQGSCILPDLACTGPADCAPLGVGFSCCGGTCHQNCPDIGIILQDMGSPPELDAAPTDSSPQVDLPSVEERGACEACSNDRECSGLGEGARCTAIGDGQFCTQACEPDEASCEPGFSCVAGLNQCLPSNYRCEGCLVEGCPAGQLCDAVSAECVAPRGACGLCNSDAECAAGLNCQEMGNFKHCFEPCGEGESCSTESYQCLGGFCKPSSAVCDACGSTCTGDLPVCIDAEEICGECGVRQACEPPLRCNQEHRCEESSGCITSVDCSDPATPFCFGAECVQCMQLSDCAPRHDCIDWSCVPSSCAGVLCQTGSFCNEETGRCDPGCQTADDCAPMEDIECNASTGQCHYNDGLCDTGGGDAVCAPGSICVPGFFDPAKGSCSCRRVEPLNPLNLAEIISCQPGIECSHGEWPWGSGQFNPNGTCNPFFF